MSQTSLVGGGVINGFLGLFGLGDLVNPLGNTQTALTDAQQHMQNVINSASFSFAKEQSNLNTDMLRYIETNNSTLQDTMKYYNLLGQQGIQKSSLFVKIFGILLFIVIFFILIN